MNLLFENDVKIRFEKVSKKIEKVLIGRSDASSLLLLRDKELLQLEPKTLAKLKEKGAIIDFDDLVQNISLLQKTCPQDKRLEKLIDHLHGIFEDWLNFKLNNKDVSQFVTDTIINIIIDGWTVNENSASISHKRINNKLDLLLEEEAKQMFLRYLSDENFDQSDAMVLDKLLLNELSQCYSNNSNDIRLLIKEAMVEIFKINYRDSMESEYRHELDQYIQQCWIESINNSQHFNVAVLDKYCLKLVMKKLTYCTNELIFFNKEAILEVINIWRKNNSPVENKSLIASFEKFLKRCIEKKLGQCPRLKEELLPLAATKVLQTLKNKRSDTVMSHFYQLGNQCSMKLLKNEVISVTSRGKKVSLELVNQVVSQIRAAGSCIEELRSLLHHRYLPFLQEQQPCRQLSFTDSCLLLLNDDDELSVGPSEGSMQEWGFKN